jgi:AraC-like DNA-binding protein
MHEYYEISLILSGEVTVLLPDASYRGYESLLLLAGPMTPHLVTCEPGLLYERINLLFSGQFLAEYVPEWRQLLSVFGKTGKIISLPPQKRDELGAMIRAIREEKSDFRARLRLLLFLSHAGELDARPMDGVPPYVSAALSYLQEHYPQRIVAADLAADLGVGRTTLMTAFKHYTGITVGEYLAQCRLKAAIARLREGMTEQTVAESCGFGDACNLIRSFRRHLGVTPKQYIAKARKGDA